MNKFEERSKKFTLNCPETDFSINFAGIIRNKYDGSSSVLGEHELNL